MGLCSGTRFGCSGVTPEHVFSVPEHVFSAPEQKIFLRATRENMFRKRVIIFGALKKFASHTGWQEMACVCVQAWYSTRAGPTPIYLDAELAAKAIAEGHKHMRIDGVSMAYRWRIDGVSMVYRWLSTFDQLVWGHIIRPPSNGSPMGLDHYP